jgi:outer membrane lipoprotein-sorting protein
MILLRPLLTICLAAGLYAAEPSLEATFARMDAVAPGFKGLTANLKQVKHTEVIHEDETDTGRISVKKASPKDLRMLIEFRSRDPKVEEAKAYAEGNRAFIGGNKAQMYYPKANLVQEFDLGKSATMRDQLMMLAFGSNSREMVRAYTVSFGGGDTVAGQKATRIMLIPKNQELAKLFPRIEMWISDETGLTLQQKMHEGGGDYVMATYSEIKLVNPADSAVKLDVPRNAKIERPQK